MAIRPEKGSDATGAEEDREERRRHLCRVVDKVYRIEVPRQSEMQMGDPAVSGDGVPLDDERSCRHDGE